MKRVNELKDMHIENRLQQKQTRANILEVDPDAILAELSGLPLLKTFNPHYEFCLTRESLKSSDSPFWDSSGDDEMERIQQLKSKSRLVHRIDDY
jgi:hypothetical protein